MVLSSLLPLIRKLARGQNSSEVMVLDVIERSAADIVTKAIHAQVCRPIRHTSLLIMPGFCPGFATVRCVAGASDADATCEARSAGVRLSIVPHTPILPLSGDGRHRGSGPHPSTRLPISSSW